MKKCSKCKLEKKENEFSKDKYRPDGLCCSCKKCRSRAKPKEILLDGQKRCSKCHEVKNKNEFYKDSTTTNGLSCYCKYCAKQKNNKINKIRFLNNKCLQCGKNKEDQIKTLCEQCIKYKKEYSKNYHQNPKIKNRINKQSRERFANDIHFRMTCNLRSRLIQAIKSDAKTGSAVRDLGCTIEELKVWIENQFLPGMNWENWGNDENEWNIDHIFPFKLCNCNNREDILKVLHYTNLRPLWRKDNLTRKYEEFQQ